MTVQTFFTFHGYYEIRILKGSLLGRSTKAYDIIALVVVLTSVYMLGLPMSGRHIH
jgi:hypothetical protein